MKRWRKNTSFFSRYSRRYPTWSFQQIYEVFRKRSRAAHVVKKVKEAVITDPNWALWQLGYKFRDAYWTNAWWRTWKTQQYIASNESYRRYYKLPLDNHTPSWTRNRATRLSLPNTAWLSPFMMHTKKLVDEKKKEAKEKAAQEGIDGAGLVQILMTAKGRRQREAKQALKEE